MHLHSLISRAKEIFLSPTDQAKLNTFDDLVSEDESIQSAMESEGGRILKKQLVDDFFIALDNLFKTNDQKYIAELQAIKKILDKLSSNKGLSNIRTYLEERLNEYAKES